MARPTAGQLFTGAFALGFISAMLLVLVVVHYRLVSFKLTASRMDFPQMDRAMIPNGNYYATFLFDTDDGVTITFSNLPSASKGK